MCVIIVKPAGVKAPAIETIKAALKTNPDGSAIVYAKGGRLETFKTMKNAEMLDYYAKNLQTLEACSFVFHARIATNGSKALKNCHGWETDGGRAAFFHNGVLQIASRGDMTDSETFLRDIYEPIREKGGRAAERAINAIIGHSKFAFIYDSGDILTYGQYYNVKGVFYSNLNHEYRPARVLGCYRFIESFEDLP